MATKDLSGLFNRQLGIITPDEMPDGIIIVGAGGIGSWTAFTLAKMGAQKLTIIDFDKVEDVNIAPQVFPITDIGKNKAEALSDFINTNMGSQIAKPIAKGWEEIEEEDKEIMLSDNEVLIMAVDSMDVRINIWEEIKFAGLGLVIDARMQKELLEVLTIKPDDEDLVKFYKTRLFPSSDVEEIPCTERAVAYNQLVIAGIIGTQVKHYAKKELSVKRFFIDLYSLSPIIN